MESHHLCEQTLSAIRRLVEANYVGRDELYAAADAMDGDARQQVCRRLAEFLAGHAEELQQLLLSSGAQAFDIAKLPTIAEAALFHLIRTNRGAAGVINAAERCEHSLKERYEDALARTSDAEAQAILKRQQDEVEFAESVLRTMSHDEQTEC
ncbi:MAG: hypothetical protein KDB14_23695 [Planctomycetales bacterium]|nr:hypothetical protein [Planctomycetales bacterium]